MGAVLESSQRIGRLTPLAEAMSCIDRRVRAVAPRRVKLAAALGRTLAADVSVARASPPHPMALRDGWAVVSEQTQDAGGYAPAILAHAPVRVETGDPMPAGTDAILDVDAVRPRDHAFEALAAAAPGDGVLPAGADVAPDQPVARAGRALRRTDIAALDILGLAEVEVHEPRIRVAAAHDNERLAIAVGLIADLASRDGSLAATTSPGLDAALPDAECVVILGGTGAGARDASVTALARKGSVDFHGLALSPGETAAFGMVEQTPVLLLPGRLDAALAVWLTLGRRILARLCGCASDEPAVSRVLARKVSSSLGLTNLVLLRREGEGVSPLASGYLPLVALTQADGYLLVPPESEGHAPGTRIDMRLLP